MNKSKNFYKDITVGVLFISGVFGFISGEFLFSTAFFFVASVISNMSYAEQAMQR